MRSLAIFFGKLLFLFKKRRVLKEPKNILVIRSGALGDVLMTTPFLKALSFNYNKAKITYLTGEWNKSVLEGNEDVDKVITFKNNIIVERDWKKINLLVAELRAYKFDLCFILDKAWQWNLFAWRCGIKNRVGFDRAGEGFCNNVNAEFKGKKYELEYYLDIARKLRLHIPAKEMQLFLGKEHKEYADRFFNENRLRGKKVVGIAAGGAENPWQKMHAKRWPLHSYEHLIKNLLDMKISVILFGGKNDVKLNEELMGKFKDKGIYNMVGRNIRYSAALMKRCSLVLTHDSGSMHIAGAAKAKLIALFGPTDPTRFAPEKATVIRGNVNCAPCYDIYGRYNLRCMEHDCMDAIKEEDVMGVIEKELR